MFKELGPFIFPLIILFIAFRRSGRSRAVRLERIWLIPAFALLSVVSTLQREPPPGFVAVLMFAVGGIAGVAAGYFRALHMELSIDPESGKVSSKATPFGSVLIAAFMVLRIGLDYLLKGSFRPEPPFGAGHHVHVSPDDLFRLADAALIFTTMMMIAQRYEIWRRGQALLMAHKAGKQP